MVRLLRMILALAFVASLTSAMRPTVDLDGSAAALRVIAKRIDKNAEIRRQYSNCPADIAFKQKPDQPAREGDVAISSCKVDPKACYVRCVTGRNGEACYRLGLAFEEKEALSFQHNAQMLFAEACALGSKPGCTNRGAGIRNGQFKGDPMLRTNEKQLAQCYFKTFELSCSDNNPWGCTMLGQAYALGEGVERDMGKAKSYFKMACDYDPDFAACKFAHNYVDGSQ